MDSLIGTNCCISQLTIENRIRDSEGKVVEVTYEELNESYNDEYTHPIDGKLVRFADHIAAFIGRFLYTVRNYLNASTEGRRNILSLYPEGKVVNGIHAQLFCGIPAAITGIVFDPAAHRSSLVGCVIGNRFSPRSRHMNRSAAIPLSSRPRFFCSKSITPALPGLPYSRCVLQQGWEPSAERRISPRHRSPVLIRQYRIAVGHKTDVLTEP